MATIRLTTGNRQVILNRILKHRFANECEKIISDQEQLADTIYRDTFKKDLKAMNELPKGWLQESENFLVQFGSRTERLSFTRYGSTAFNFLSFKKGDATKRRFKSKDCFRNRITKAYDAKSPFSVKSADIKEAERCLIEAVNAAASEINAMTHSVTTLAKLIEIWPEAEPFCHSFGEKVANLPAVQIGELNKALDLPVKA